MNPQPPSVELQPAEQQAATREAAEPRVQNLLSLHEGIQGQDPAAGTEPAAELPAAAPTPDPLPRVREADFEVLSPTNARAFYLLHKNVPEEYLGQFRQLRGRLLLQRDGWTGSPTLQVLAVTSPHNADGKTFVSMNLGLMLAVAPGARVLVADLNVHHPAVSSRLALPETPGVREAMAGKAWTEVARRLPGIGLHVACLGKEGASTLDPINYGRLREWLSAMRTLYDWVILDTPSLVNGPEAEVLSYLADGTLVVAPPGRLSFAEMDTALAKLERKKLAGVVYNGRH